MQCVLILFAILFLPLTSPLWHGAICPWQSCGCRRTSASFLCGKSFSAGDVDDDGREATDEELEALADNLPSKRMRSSLSSKKGKKPKPAPARAEFSRIINVASIPDKRAVLCKLLAKPAERAGLALRFDLPELSYFAANVTVRRRDPYTLLIEGTIEARITASTLLPPQEVQADFDTLVLDNLSSGKVSGLTFEDATDYDEEIGSNGDIDIGEIAAQYFSLELFS